jgi:hypothetical protein
MTENERAAYLSAQVACAMIEALGMMSENMQRQHRGESMAYTEEAFTRLQEQYPIGHNAALTWLKEPY